MIYIHHKGTDIAVTIYGIRGVLEPITTAAECRKFPPFSSLPMEWMFSKPFKPSIASVVERYK